MKEKKRRRRKREKDNQIPPHLGLGHLGVVRRNEQDVLGLEVGVNERQLVHVRNRLEQLPPKRAHHVQRERAVLVALQEVEQAGAQPLEYLPENEEEADVSIIANQQ